MRFKQRVIRGLRKLASGVPLGGERVWPCEPTDLLVAHRSIYGFFAERARRRRVLDAGCGLGYGSAQLADAGARSVLGIDVSRAAIAFARRRYRRPGLAFEVADCEQLSLAPTSVDLVVSSNVLEHLTVPERFFRRALPALDRGGEMIVAVPPNNDPGLRRDSARNPHHTTHLDPDGWLSLFRRLGLAVRTFAHRHPSQEALDFAASTPSRFRVEDFTFPEVDPSALAGTFTLTAVFLLRREASAQPAGP